jgi:hypothetical protein
MIFYHGARRWTFPLHFSSYADLPEGFSAFVPDFRTILYYASVYPFDEGKRSFLEGLLKYILQVDCRAIGKLEKAIVRVLDAGSVEQVLDFLE